MSGGSRSSALLLALALTVLPSAVRDVRAAPQVTMRTELDLSGAGVLRAGSSLSTLWIAAVHVDIRLSYGTSALVLRLDPGILTAPTRESTWGLTEAYLEWRRPRYDFRLGVERIPLETARLTLPFSIEPVDVLGTRQGRLGARLNWYPDPATRVRLALLDHDGRLHPAASLRYASISYEIEAHALAFHTGRLAYGIGASGLIGTLVAYGEMWMLTTPSESRYAVGMSGSFTDGLWTVEAGYGAASAGSLARLQPAGVPARLQVAGQVTRRLDGELTVTGTARIFSDPDAYRGQAAVEVTRTAGDATFTLALLALVGPEPMHGVVLAGVRFAF